MQILHWAIFDLSRGTIKGFWIAFQNGGDLKLIWRLFCLSFVFGTNLLSFWSELCDFGTQTWTKPKQHAEDFIIINDRYAKEDWPKIYYLWIQKIYFGTAGFLNALTNRPKSLSPPRTRKRKDTLSTMDVEPDLKLTSYIGAVVKTYFSSVLLSYMPSFTETKMGCF